MSKFADIFKQLRVVHGLTQQDIAIKLGVSRSSIGMYESGDREPSIDLLEKIADYFDVNVDYLLGRSKELAIGIENLVAETIEPSCNDSNICENEEWTADELAEIENFKAYVKSKRQFSQNRSGTCTA